MSPKDRDPSAPPPDVTAAPPDDAHQGSYTVPSDTLQEPTSSSPYGPPLHHEPMHHDPASAARRGGSLGVFVLLAILILGLVALVLYA